MALLPLPTVDKQGYMDPLKAHAILSILVVTLMDWSQ